MLKYQKLKNGSRPDSLLAIILSVAQLMLVLIGLIGISVEFFRDKGWLKQTLSAIMNTSISAMIIALPVILLVFLVGKSWMNSQSEREASSLAGDLMLYFMMLVGAWFIFSYFSSGDI
jgi:uncharacterized membrane protein